jgi:hypothetical protein
MLKSEKAPELKLYKGLATVAWSALLSIIVYGLFVNGWDRTLVEEANFLWLGNDTFFVNFVPAFVHMATFWVGFLFFLLLFTLAWELWPLGGVADTRIRAVLIFAICAVAAHIAEWMVIEGNPAAVEAFNYFWFMADMILFLLILILAFGGWPIAGSSLDVQPMKGAVISALLLVVGFITYFIANDDKELFSDWTVILYIPTLFIMIPWLLWYALLMEKWPLAELKQPVNGIVVVALTAFLTYITYAMAADLLESGNEVGHMGMQYRTWDYITFCGVWTFYILVFAFTLKGWPCMAGTALGGQPVKGIVLLFVTGILAAVTQYMWLWAVGGEDNLIDLGFGPIDELLLLAVWFWVVLNSFLLFLTLHCEGGA